MEHGLAEWDLLSQIGTENEGAHDARVVNVPAKYTEEKDAFLLMAPPRFPL
jgi:hypothetical protein